MNFCQFKTAYLLDRNDFPNIVNDIIENDVFRLFEDSVTLPTEWELTGTDISGAAGFVLVFDIYHAPTQNDLNQVDLAIRNLECKLEEAID